MKKETLRYTKTVYTPDKCYFQVIESPGIRVSLFKIRKKGSPYYISIWGDDDIGMINSYLDLDEAKKIYAGIKDGVTEKELIGLGFEQY